MYEIAIRISDIRSSNLKLLWLLSFHKVFPRPHFCAACHHGRHPRCSEFHPPQPTQLIWIMPQNRCALWCAENLLLQFCVASALIIPSLCLMWHNESWHPRISSRDTVAATLKLGRVVLYIHLCIYVYCLDGRRCMWKERLLLLHSKAGKRHQHQLRPHNRAACRNAGGINWRIVWNFTLWAQLPTCGKGCRLDPKLGKEEEIIRNAQPSLLS